MKLLVCNISNHVLQKDCFSLSLVKLNLAAVSEDIFLCQAAGVGTADPAAEAHSLASN